MDEPLVVLAIYPYLHEANSAKEYLEEAGFSPVLLDVNAINTDWYLTSPDNGIKVAVPESQVDEARPIIEEFNSTPADSEATAEGHCLACGAEMPAEDAVCAECGWTFQAGTEAN